MKPFERQPNEYRTLWIYPNGNDIEYIEKKNVIITPYKDEFLKLENNKFNAFERNDEQYAIEGNFYSQYSYYYNFFNIISYPADSKAKDLYTKETFELENSDNGWPYRTGMEWLKYVGNNYACVMNYYF